MDSRLCEPFEFPPGIWLVLSSEDLLSSRLRESLEGLVLALDRPLHARRLGLAPRLALLLDECLVRDLNLRRVRIRVNPIYIYIYIG